jgi:DNA polymerase-3 subunit alpha
MAAGDAFGTPEQMVERAVELGWSAVCLSDHGWMGGAPALYKAAYKVGIKPIIGCELYVTPDHLHGIRGKAVDGHTFHLTVLALSKEGYQNLVIWQSEAMLRDNFHRRPRISLYRMVEIAAHGLHHNVILSGCLASELCRTLEHGHMGMAVDYVNQMKIAFPNFYIELVDHELSKFMKDDYPAYVDLIQREADMREKLVLLAEITNTPTVVTNDSHMTRSSDRRAHIAQKASGWRNRDDDHLSKSQEQVIAKYLPDYTYYGAYLQDMEKIVDRGRIPSDALDNVRAIVEEADIRLEPLDNFSYSIPPSGRTDPVAAIRARAKHRLRNLRIKHGDAARVRFEHELEAMADFADYLLLMSDFIREAKRQGILTWTRGSAANSLVAYCLEIHEIDSIEYGLIFSRFFNPARKKLPDIDVDIQPSRYGDFMRIVQEKMEPLVGSGQIVQISNWGTAANRKAFRMAASALGMSKEKQDEVAKLLPQMIDSGMADEDTDVFMALREDYPDLYEIASDIFDSITSVSQHACAWVFGTSDRPVAEWVPLYLIASSGTLVTQYDFKTLEDFGLTKMDFLRLKTLDVAANTLRAAGKSPLEFHDIPVDDSQTLKMFRDGQTEGVHTVQGKEVRRGCVAVGVETVHDVILVAALYRPANTRENKDRLYVERRYGHERVQFEHEILERVLGPTHGVPVFQEQAMEIVYDAGGSHAFVDDVYQGIKKAKGAGRGAKEIFDELQPKFVKLCRRNLGATEKEALAIWNEVKSFQGYGFNKGHATSYGVLAMKVGYLKQHMPGEFYAALLDTFPERSTYIAAARAEGYQFLPPDVNRSQQGFTLDKLYGNSIRVGVGKVFNLGPVGRSAIVNEQPFSSWEDFRERIPSRSVNSRAAASLQAVGALEPLGLPGAGNEDVAQFQFLGFTLDKPKVFRGCKPKHVRERTSESGWRHLGRERGLETTDVRCSVSKLFWIPPDTTLELQASPWAQVKTWLLKVIDENGVPFHLMVNEDRDHDAKLLKFLHRRCQGTVICADGMVRLPFKSDGPQGFRFFGLTGSFEGDPQIFRLPDAQEEKYKQAISELDRMKRIARYR